jgi:hypothetical protein
MVFPALAQDLPMVDYSYIESFEEGDSPVKTWVTNGEYETNFMGITDEKAFDGTHSFKLDITIKSGSYHYFHVPLRIPLEGKLDFSGHIFIEEGDGISVGLGPNMFFPPTTESGCGSFESFKGPTGEWREIEGDLIARASQTVGGIMARYTAGATAADVGKYLDRWGIFVRGGSGHLVVYIDDVRIEGRVVEDKAYQADIAERFKDFEAKWDARIVGWTQRIDAAEQQLAAVPDVPAQLQALVTGSSEGLAAGREQLARFEKKGYARATDVDELEGRIVAGEQAPQILATIAAALARGEKLLALEVPAMSNARVIPGDLAIPGVPAQTLAMAGCAGEYESASLVILPVDDVSGLLVTPSDLTCDAGTIPAANVDVKLVKVWYQAGRSIGDLKHKQLVPELLLNDDALVRVDIEAEANYLRSTAEDGTETYMLASDPNPKSGHLGGVRPIDADTLQPLDLPALRSQQYWVTVQVPDDAGAGEYSGALQIASTGAEATVVPMTVSVHPFALEPCPLTYSVYYRARLVADDVPTITSEGRSEEQYLAEMKHLQTHGVLYPTTYQRYDETLLPRSFQLREEAGLPSDTVYTLGVTTGAPASQEALDTLVGRVEQYMALAKEYGCEQVYFYGIDEARGERLAAQKAAWRILQDKGARTFVACYKDTCEAMGSLLNVAVLAGAPDPVEAEKFHGVGSRVFTYAFPQVGPEESETFRRNFGLRLWQAGFDGAMDYAYQHGFGHVWNDFDATNYRDHNFAYPTVNGVVGTVQIEGYREASDDVRYMATLLAAIDKCEDAGAKAAAQAWVDDLDVNRDLYEVRTEMVAHILACKGLN